MDTFFSSEMGAGGSPRHMVVNSQAPLVQAVILMMCLCAKSLALFADTGTQEVVLHRRGPEKCASIP